MRALRRRFRHSISTAKRHRVWELLMALCLVVLVPDRRRISWRDRSDHLLGIVALVSPQEWLLTPVGSAAAACHWR